MLELIGRVMVVHERDDADLELVGVAVDSALYEHPPPGDVVVGKFGVSDRA